MSDLSSLDIFDTPVTDLSPLKDAKNLAIEMGGKSVAKFLHVDCDVYSSTVDIFNTLTRKIVAGTVIVFDDYCNYTGWRKGEWKAWKEFVERQNLNYEYLDVGGMAVSLIVR